MVWFKGFDITYVVMQVHSDNNVRPEEANGCFFLAIEFREVIRGDVIHSEEDLFWMPLQSECRKSVLKLTVRAVLGPEELCTFNIHRPPKDRVVRSSAVYIPERYRLFGGQSADDNSPMAGESAEIARGYIPIGFELSAASRASNDDDLKLRFVENVGSQTLFSAFTNIEATYPTAVLRKEVLVVAEPYDEDLSQRTMPMGVEVLAGTARKLSAMITVDSTLDDVIPRRVLTFVVTNEKRSLNLSE